MERPKVGVGVIVRKDGKVLMLRRSGAHGQGTWCFPGGHLEFDEEVEDCAKRETLEESGVTIKNLQRGPYTNDIHDEEDKHYITLFIISDHDTGEPYITEPDKCSEIGWFDWHSLPQPLFLPVKNLKESGFNPFK